MKFKRGQNPRLVLEQHRERGPKRFLVEITYSDLANLFEMTEVAVRKAVSRGQIDPESMDSIVDYYQHRRSNSLHRLVEEARSLTGIED